MMESTVAIPTDLKDRVEALSAKTTMSPAEIVRQALEEGRSLDWQERWIAGIEEGLAQADRGEFASPEEIERVLNKYRTS